MPCATVAPLWPWNKCLSAYAIAQPRRGVFLYIAMNPKLKDKTLAARVY